MSTISSDHSSTSKTVSVDDQAQTPQNHGVETFQYDDQIVRMFTTATIVWGLVATLVGLLVAIFLVVPWLTSGLPWIAFGRLRPLHTNAAIFAFAGNAIFAAIYYST